jgi:D-alanyl-D-alanine carboxypeptidase
LSVALPDDNQVTTARDQALLGRTIQKHFPRAYKYFSSELPLGIAP